MERKKMPSANLSIKKLESDLVIKIHDPCMLNNHYLRDLPITASSGADHLLSTIMTDDWVND